MKQEELIANLEKMLTPQQLAPSTAHVQLCRLALAEIQRLNAEVEAWREKAYANYAGASERQEGTK